MATLTDPSSISPLTNPSHSQLHTAVNTELRSLDQRLDTLEAQVPQTALNITQARLAAHEWVVRGDLAADHMIMMPVLWNITGRVVQFEAAKLTVLTPADADIVVDILTGTELTGPEHDHDGGTQTSILTTPLVIPAGQFYSVTLEANDFVGVHAMNSYLAAFCEGAGSAGAPGADLTVQLNRLL